MANDDWIKARGGLRPLAPYGKVRTNLYKLTTNATVGVYVGAPMDLDGAGCVLATTGADNTFVVGPALGFVASRTEGGIPTGMTSLTQGGYLPANTDAYVLIADEPSQLFTIQADTSSAIGAESVGCTCRFAVRAGNGNAATGSSYAELLASDAATDTGGCLKLIALLDNINADGTINTGSANYTKWVVGIYRHRLNAEGVTANPV